MMKQGAKRSRKKKDDSDDSDWSQIDKPGQSRVDKLIRQRNRFSMHFHKQDFISIPQENRFPLLPNEQIYDWEEQRKLLIINKEYNLKQPVPQKKPRQYIQQVLSQKDQVDNLTNNQWANISKEEITNRLRTQSIKLLQGASKTTDFQLSKLDDIYLPQISESEFAKNQKFNKNLAKYFYHDDKIKKKRGRPRKHPIKQPSLEQFSYRFTPNIPPQSQIQRNSQLRIPQSPGSNQVPCNQIQNTRQLLAPQISQDDESMDISLDLEEGNEESFINT